MPKARVPVRTAPPRKGYSKTGHCGGQTLPGTQRTLLPTSTCLSVQLLITLPPSLDVVTPCSIVASIVRSAGVVKISRTASLGQFVSDAFSCLMCWAFCPSPKCLQIWAPTSRRSSRALLCQLRQLCRPLQHEKSTAGSPLPHRLRLGPGCGAFDLSGIRSSGCAI